MTDHSQPSSSESSARPMVDAFREARRAQDAARDAAFGEAIVVQNLAQPLLEHEALRLERKLGAEHPRVQSLRAGFSAGLERLQSLEVERQITSITIPRVDDKDALVDGRVSDESGRGFAGLLVVLVDRKGAPIHHLPRLTTNPAGYYAFVLDAAAVKVVHGFRAGVFLAVCSPQGQELFRSTEVLEVGPGVRLRREVVVSRQLPPLQADGGAASGPVNAGPPTKKTPAKKTPAKKRSRRRKKDT